MFYIFHDGYSLKVSKKYQESGSTWFQTHMGKLKCSCVDHYFIEDIIVKHKNGGKGRLLQIFMHKDGLNYGIYWENEANSGKSPNHYFWNKAINVEIEYEVI